MKPFVLLIKNVMFVLNPSGHSYNNSSPKSREDKHGPGSTAGTRTGTLLSPAAVS